MIARIVNQMLSHLGIALIRKDTLNRLIAPTQSECQISELKLLLKSLKDEEDSKFKELLRHQISTKWGIIDAAARHLATSASMTCPLCDYRGESAKFSTFVTSCIFGGGELLRHQCPECDLVFGAEKMFALSEAELSRDYEWHYKVFSEGDSTAQELRAFHALNPTKEGVYLNWGAGAWSKSIDELRLDGWNVYGYEPHGSASSGGLYIISSQAELLDMHFDGIFSNNVLEHLRYPVRELSSLSERLKPGGKMSHATPCFEYLYEFTRFHLFFFLGRSRSVLARKAKLHIEDFVVDGEFMNLILSLD